MNNNLLLAAVCIIMGIVIGTSFKGCNSTPVDPVIEYVDKVVEVPVESIVYLPGEVRDTTIYETKWLPGKTEYVFDTGMVSNGDSIKVPIHTNITDKPFHYKDSLIEVNGIAAIVADTIYKFSLKKFEVKYKQKNTTIVKEKTFGLYAGGGLGFRGGDIKAINLGLDLAIKQKTLVGVSWEQPLQEGSQSIYWVNIKRSFW